MEWQKGDRVRFLNEVGSGRVLRMLDARTAMVMTDEGFEYPVSTDELIREAARPPSPEPKAPHALHASKGKGGDPSRRAPEKDLEKATKPTDAPAARGSIAMRDEAAAQPFPPEYQGSPSRNLYLGFHTAALRSPGDGPFTLLAINESPLWVYITVAREAPYGLSTLYHGSVPPLHTLRLGTLTAQELRMVQRVHVQALYFSEGLHIPPSPLDSALTLKFSNFERPGSFQNTPFTKAPLLLQQVISTQEGREESGVGSDGEDLRAAREAHPRDGKGNSKETLPQEAPRVPARDGMGNAPLTVGGAEGLIPDSITVDLLQEQARANRQGLTPAELTAEQLELVNSALRQALTARTAQRLVVIHGVGNTELRQRVIKLLRADYPALTYQDASFREFNYGAIMIFLRPSAKGNRKQE